MSLKANQKDYSITKLLPKNYDDVLNTLFFDNIKLIEFVERAATPKRPDGTYNYCREALEEQAKEILHDIGYNEKLSIQ